MMFGWVALLSAGYIAHRWLDIQAYKAATGKGGPAMMGFSFRKTLSRAGRAAKKSARSVDWNAAAKAAVTYGPMIASMHPAAAPFVAAGMQLNNAAAAGDPVAVAKVAAIQSGAASGNPEAQASLNALKVAQVVAAKAQQQNDVMGLWC